VTGGDAGPPGEPFAAFLARRVREDPYLQELKALAPWLQAPSLEGVHPADWTETTWADHWPTEWPGGEKEVPSRTFAEDRRKALEWGFKRACYRIVIDFFDQWANKGVILLGRRADGALKPVPPKLRNSHFMVLHVRKGLLGPAPWQGQTTPADLQRHTYSELTVQPPVERRERPEQVGGKQPAPLPESEPASSAELAEPAIASDADLDNCIKASAAGSKDGKTSGRQLRIDAPPWFAKNHVRPVTQADMEDRLLHENNAALRRGAGKRRG
jgi:hypothetical protein